MAFTKRQGLQDLRCRLLPKTRQLGHSTAFTGRLEVRQRAHLELLPQHLDFFAPQPLHLIELQDPLRKLPPQPFIELQLPRAGQLVQLLLQGITQAFYPLEIVGCGAGHNVTTKGLHDLRSRIVRPGLEGVFPLEVEQERDVSQYSGHHFSSHSAKSGDELRRRNEMCATAQTTTFLYVRATR